MNLAEIPIPCLGHGLRSKRIPVEEWGRFQGLVLDSRIKSRDSTTRSHSDPIPIPTQYAYKIQIQNRDVMMLKKNLQFLFEEVKTDFVGHHDLLKTL